MDVSKWYDGWEISIRRCSSCLFISPPDWVPAMVWRVQGEYFHLASSEKQVMDLIQRVRLEDKGFRVVDILAHDVLTNRDEVLTAALGGEQLKPTQILV